MSRQRHALQEDEARRDHVARKPRLEEIAKLVDFRLPAGRSDDMRDQPRLAAEVIPRQHDGGLDVRVLHEHVLDLLELDPVAANLHLVVDAAKALKRPVGTPSGQVAGPVQTRRPAVRERVAKEASAGLFRIVEVTAAHADASDAQLPRDPDWHRLQVSVEHIEACVGYGAADRHGRERRRCRRKAMRCDVVGTLRRAIGID